MMQFTSSHIYLVLSLLHCLTFAQTSYPYETWMKSFPSTQNLYDKTIYDITLPGSRSAGMISNDITNSSALGTNNGFNHARFPSSLSTEDKQLWSARQHVSILNQLRSGSRFLAFEIEENNNNEFHSYNALLTSTNINDIISDINEFITQHGSEEIIILYFNSFSNMDASKFQAFYDIFTTSNLNSKMVPNTEDLSTYTLQNMLDSGQNIIAFTDDITNAPNTFFNSNNNLYIPTTSDSSANLTRGFIDEISEARTFITSSIRHGWPNNELNIIYWTFDIVPIGPFTQLTDYNSFYSYNAPLSAELNTFIQTYPKLRFGNVILVDFIESSDVVEQSILLNYDYFSCSDTIFNNNITGCPSETVLSIEFKNDGISTICAQDNSLNTQCQRSCGSCPILTNIPGSDCISSSDCNSPLYSAYSVNSNSNGECFIRSDSESNYISKESFCLSLSDGYISCGNFEGNDICNNQNYNYICDNYCSSDYQCINGYCNSEYLICMTLNPSNNSNGNTFNFTKLSDEKYSGVTSSTAERYRHEVNVFRSGDPDAAYPSGDTDLECDEYSSACFFENLDANPYINSVLGLMLLVIIFMILFCTCFIFCCPFWCFCDKCCKNCCCTPIYGKIEKEKWNSLFKEWGACIALLIIMIIIFAFTIEGIISNQALHSHIFNNNDKDSFISASNRLFNDIEDKFGSADNFTDFIIDNIENILDNVNNIIGGNEANDIKNNINIMYKQLNIMYNNYSTGVDIEGEVRNPFNTTMLLNFSLHCSYCDSIPAKILDVNNTLRDSSQNILNDVIDTINSTGLFVDSRDTINEATTSFTDSINEILRISNSTQESYNSYMDTASEYDSERETYVTLFFCLMFLFIIIPIIGVLLKSKWCFKINWCLAMICVILLLFISIPFIFIITLSADFCVRLDEFEQALPNNAANTQLGKDILFSTGNNNTASASPGGDAFNVNDTLNLIDTCFNGGSLLSVFNLSNALDWDEYKQQLYDSLNLDTKQLFTINELESFQTEISTLDISEYSTNVQEAINKVNSIPGCYCVDKGEIFNENNLNPGTQCTPQGYTPSANALSYWTNVSYVNLIECIESFENASYAVQIWNQSYSDAVDRIDTLKKDSQKIFDIFDIIYSDVNGLINNLQNITCLIDPLLDDFQNILNKFTNCGFLGERYGDFKTVACVTLFTDFYKIGRAIVIIAFLLLLIILCSFCLDYVYGPWKPKHQFDESNENNVVYIGDDNNNNKQIELEVANPNVVTPIAPNDTKPSGFGRIGSASPKSPGDVDGDGEYTVPQNNYDENENDPLDEMDGGVTGNNNNNNNNEMDGGDDDEYPILPNDTDLGLGNNKSDEFPILPNEQNVENDGLDSFQD